MRDIRVGDYVKRKREHMTQIWCEVSGFYREKHLFKVYHVDDHGMIFLEFVGGPFSDLGFDIVPAPVELPPLNQ